MLSGIKKGKRKRKSKDGEEGGSEPKNAPAPVAAAAASSSSNQSVADQLRQSLLGGGSATTTTTASSTELPHERLERRGRIQAALKNVDNHTESATILHLPPDSKMSVDEEMARNVVRLGKKRKQKAGGGGVDSDEEEHRLMSLMIPNETGKPKAGAKLKKEDAKAQHRTASRHLALQDRQDQLTSACWWWLESSKFTKHRLLSLGNYVSLVMAPLNKSLVQGRHFYIVPLQHAPSLAGCDDDVWDEIQRFQEALRQYFDKEYKQGVLFSETVLETNKFWQTRMEVIPVKRKKWLDSELFFQSALTEQADDENGTHTKLLSTKGKGLRRTVPNNNQFPYFYIEWDRDSTGLATILEDPQFSSDFAADTIAGMTGADPVRFQRKKQFSTEQEREHIVAFLEKWKKYDWTEQLDS